MVEAAKGDYLELSALVEYLLTSAAAI